MRGWTRWVGGWVGRAKCLSGDSGWDKQGSVGAALETGDYSTLHTKGRPKARPCHE